MNKRLLWATLVAALPACVQPPASQLERPPPVGLTEVEPQPAPPAVAAEPRLEGQVVLEPAAPPFSLTSKLELPVQKRRSFVGSVALTLTVVGAKPGLLAVEFVTPQGQVYERREHRLNGRVHDTQEARFELPVAGTWIDSAALHGTWQVNVTLDDVALRTLEFEVAP